ncbi:hypothetical protein B0H21DRAFT_690632 [Amylocystis lapponica]|nr:hypothetical protein B0H21DRAFT_690632 [Amylocystis lapponica]
MEDPSAPNDKPVSLRHLIQPTLTRLTHASAPFISTFLLIHLSAPIMANIGGSSLSSQVMLLGREYYQTSLGEKCLVLAPLVVHPLTALAKRALAPRYARPVTSVLSMTGFAAVLVVPFHYLTHRSFPTDPSPPIYAIGPAELDFEYVKFALHAWPWRSWLVYVGLTACVAFHAVEGMNVILNTYARGTVKSSVRGRAVAAASMVLPVITGLIYIAREPLLAFASQASQYHAAFSKHFLYRI